jgi:hypothetical protein
VLFISVATRNFLFIKISRSSQSEKKIAGSQYVESLHAPY